MLSSIFSREIRDDVVYIVFQHMPNEKFTRVLVKCFEDECRAPVVYVKDKSELEPGG